MNVLVTGDTSFLGRRLVPALEARGHRVLGWSRCVPDVLADNGWGRPDLRLPDETSDGFIEAEGRLGRIDAVVHLAGFNGGIKFNRENPFRIFHDNTLMALNVLEAARRNGVNRFLGVVASCAYPELHDHPLDGRVSRQTCPADEFLDGPPHDSVACHGYAKRNLQLACSFAAQHGMDASCVCPTTLYGPGDSYDPDRTKVMGAMVKRFVDAADEGLDRVAVWGSGRPLREFLYADDAAALIARALECYHDSGRPLNLGSGQELTIKALAEKVARAAGYPRHVSWDVTMPDGQYRKRLDISTQRRLFPDFAPTPLDYGIDRTVADYRERKRKFTQESEK